MPKFIPRISKDREFYFAYGMNTDPRNMSNDSKPLGAAVLSNHRFRFAHHADVVPDTDNNVVGVLWSISHDELAMLDQREGMPHYYRRFQLPVYMDGNLYDAWVYRMEPGNKDAEPGDSYVDMLFYGYRKYGVPTGQIIQALQEFQE